MPRNVRPAWLVAGCDGRASEVGLGPRDKDGWLWGRITLRTPAGEVSDEITWDAGGRHHETGAPRLAIDIPASFTVEVDTDARGTHLTIRAR